MRATRSRSIGIGVAAVVAGALVLGTGQAHAETTTPTATATATATPTTTPTPTPTATPAPAPTAGSTDTTTSIAEMDRTGNHQMGAGIARFAGERELTTVVPQASSAAGARTQATAQAATAGGPPPGKIQGFDISAWQPNVNFRNAYNAGARFAYIKATEGVSYVSPVYKEHYATARTRNIIRGGYVYAQPSQASGAATANFFFKNGGGWSADGLTLPPLLDIEYGSASQGVCYGKSWADMRSWIKDFSNTVYKKIGRYPLIYTTTDWWKRCTNNSSQFQDNPLFVALYPVKDFTNPGTVGNSWKNYSFWQWASSGPLPGDQDVYRSTMTNLKKMATRRD
ncbi:GH25 family lysozyme [Curtobacterium sp. 458]|uniref:GH25 family lysozyme n=2 Tax=unclassified Curtobacterium TaxID=257496 RepID=UPI0025B449B9|nr:GH25 family lysozyme [Curtobacterium sp. 458]WJX98925.1 GH25 family lysozyme [Curtobacterium sp. 458]